MSPGKADAGTVSHQDDGRGILVSEGDRPILRYNYQPHPDVAGRDPASSPAAVTRSGYIHPVWTPKGHLVTEAFPESHFHHLGVWGAWVKTGFKGEAYDFWNLKNADEAEQVSFTAWASAPESDGDSTRFKAKHVYTVAREAEPEVVLEESLEVKVFSLNEGNAFDYIVTQAWQGEAPLILPKHRYGGMFAWRYPSQWEDSSVVAVSSEGRTQMLVKKRGIDGSRARWLKVEGLDGDQTVGFLMMSHPSNPRHPEPTRLLYCGPGKGGYVHFTPIREEGWQLNRGDRQVFRYRALAYDGTLGAERAEALWQAYAAQLPSFFDKIDPSRK
jgi:hypothetical protein